MPFITDLLSKVTNLRIKIGDKLNTLKREIGQLDSLTTNDKSSLVLAVNEVNRKAVVNDGKLTINATNGLTGSGSFTANQQSNSNIDIKIDDDTLTKINNGNVAHSWGNHDSAGYLKLADISNKANTDGGNIINITQWQNKLQIGNLTTLTTSDKTSLVGAVNEVNNIEIGGRNYVSNSQTPTIDMIWGGTQITSTIVDYNSKKVRYIKSVGGSSSLKAYKGLGTPKAGEVVSVSFRVKTLSKPVRLFSNQGSRETIIEANTEQYVKWEGIVGNGNGSVQVQLCTLTIEETLDIYIWDLKYEIGNKATDWTPAPEDQVSDWAETNSDSLSFIKGKEIVNNEFNNIYDQINSRANNRLSNLASDLTPREKGTIRDKIGVVLPTVNDGKLTLTTGTGLNGSTNFTANQSSNSIFDVSVANTHKLPTVEEWDSLPTTNTITRLRGTTSGTYTSGDLTLLAGNNVSIAQSGNNFTINTTDTNTTYTAGTGLSLTGTTFANTAPNATHTGDVTGATALTITNSAVTHAKYQNIATQRILGRGAAGTGNVQELTLGANLTLSTDGVLSATNTNTTYSAGTGLSLTGTTFGQAITTSGTGSFVTGITQTANGFQVNLGTPPNTTYTTDTLAILNAGTSTTGALQTSKNLNDWLNGKGFATITSLSNYITTNSTQTGLSGDKTTSGIWTLGEVRKAGQNDTQILLAGGGHRPVSDFALASSFNNYLPKSYGSTSAIAVSYLNSSITSGRFKIRLPYSTSGSKMLAFTIRMYGTYTHTDIACSGYLYSSINQWYAPSAKMIVAHGQNPNIVVDVIFGRDTDGIAYVSIPKRDYVGIAILDVVGGFQAGVYGTGWTITEDDTTPNIATTVNVEGLNRLGQFTNDVGFVTSDTITRLRGTTSGTYTSGDLTLLAGSNVSIAQSGNNFTINAIDTNTTYTAGNGLTLSGTTFSLPVTTSGSGNVVSAITQTTNGISVSKDISAMTTSHVANGITSTNITNWNTAFTNNHTHSNKANLDLINQSLETTASPTFVNVTATNFNGNASFLQLNPTGLLNATYGSNGGILQDSSSGPEANSWSNRIKILHSNSQGYYTELAHSFTGTEGLWHRRNSAGTVSAWKRIVDGSITNVVGGHSPFGSVNWKVKINASDYATAMDVFVHENSRFTIGSTSNDFESIKLLTTYGSVIFDDEGLQSSLGITAPAFYESSLRKYKKNIKEYSNSALDIVKSLDVVTYDRTDSDISNKIGIIADDSHEDVLNEEKTAVDLYKTIFVLTKAVQELNSKNKELVNKNNELEKRLERLEKRLERLERMLENLLEK